MLPNCSEPSYVFHDFDHLQDCYRQHGGIANSNPFAQVVNDCLNDYCSDPFPQLEGCGQWTRSTDLNFSITYNSSIFMGYTAFNNDATCANVKGETNPDIAGPGIFLAYMMQLVMVMYLWFFLRLSRQGPWIVSCFSERRKRSQELIPVPPAPQKKKNPVKAKVTQLFHRHNSVLKHTLIEFQEAQCFFMLASQIAILVSTKYTAAFESYTLRSLLGNYGVAGLVSSTGILPVVLGLWCLQKMHKCSPWILALSVVTIIVSEVALFGTRGAPSMNQIAPMEYNQWPASCGYSAPPLVYCGISTAQIETRVLIRGGSLFFSQWSNPFCLVILGLVIFLWVKAGLVDAIHGRSRKGFFLERIGIAQLALEIQRHLDSTWGTWLRCAAAFVTCLVEVALIAALVMDMPAFQGLNVVELIDWSAWSFGQIVAITLWLPVVSKYFYWLMFGATAYSKARIPSPYKIVKQQSDETRGDYDRVRVLSVQESKGGKC